MVNLVRYADDFVITGCSKELLEGEVRPLVEGFLAERGLELSPEKTTITPIDQGFDFLGQTVRKYRGKLLITPSKESVEGFLSKVRGLIGANKQATAGGLIALLNPVIRGWANHHRHVVSSETFGKVDAEIFKALWRWARRRHPGKGARWVRGKYFGPHGGRAWTFQGETWVRGDRRTARLFYAGDVGIRRHVKVKGEANPYDPAWWAYFERRSAAAMVRLLEGRSYLLALWERQGGRCPACGRLIEQTAGWHNHHVVRKVDGRGDELSATDPRLHPDDVSAERVRHRRASFEVQSTASLAGAWERLERCACAKLARTSYEMKAAGDEDRHPRSGTPRLRVPPSGCGTREAGLQAWYEVLGNNGRRCGLVKSYALKARGVEVPALRSGTPRCSALRACTSFGRLLLSTRCCPEDRRRPPRPTSVGGGREGGDDRGRPHPHPGQAVLGHRQAVRGGRRPRPATTGGSCSARLPVTEISAASPAAGPPGPPPDGVRTCLDPADADGRLVNRRLLTKHRARPIRLERNGTRVTPIRPDRPAAPGVVAGLATDGQRGRPGHPVGVGRPPRRAADRGAELPPRPDRVKLAVAVAWKDGRLDRRGRAPWTTPTDRLRRPARRRPGRPPPGLRAGRPRPPHLHVLATRTAARSDGCQRGRCPTGRARSGRRRPRRRRWRSTTGTGGSSRAVGGDARTSRPCTATRPTTSTPATSAARCASDRRAGPMCVPPSPSRPCNDLPDAHCSPTRPWPAVTTPGGARKEVRFDWRARPARLPVWRNGAAVWRNGRLAGGSVREQPRSGRAAAAADRVDVAGDGRGRPVGRVGAGTGGHPGHLRVCERRLVQAQAGGAGVAGSQPLRPPGRVHAVRAGDPVLLGNDESLVDARADRRGYLIRRPVGRRRR